MTKEKIHREEGSPLISQSLDMHVDEGTFSHLRALIRHTHCHEAKTNIFASLHKGTGPHCTLEQACTKTHNQAPTQARVQSIEHTSMVVTIQLMIEYTLGYYQLINLTSRGNGYACSIQSAIYLQYLPTLR